jgi:hypothetical protein
MTDAEVDADSRGCVSCHTGLRRQDHAQFTGGEAGLRQLPRRRRQGRRARRPGPEVEAVRRHPRQRPRAAAVPKTWHFPSAANPKQSYTLLNKESPAYVRFVNPSDYRVARQSCGACHIELIERAERSLMATGAMFFGGASYNNGILPFKNYILGEAYTHDGEPATLKSAEQPAGTVTPEQAKRGHLPILYPARPGR